MTETQSLGADGGAPRKSFARQQLDNAAARRETKRLENEQIRLQNEARFEAQRLADEQRRKDDAATWWSQSTDALASATTRAGAIVAYRAFTKGAAILYPADSAARVEQALVDMDFDRSLMSSPRYGYVSVLEGGSVEFFRDCVIYGRVGHDIEATTRGQVYVDGAIQVSTSVVVDAKGRQQLVERRHDMRTAQMQLTSMTWSMSVPIHPDTVNEARQYVDQMSIHAGELQPKNATVADMRELVDSILQSSGQPPAEKLKQLSNLRYDRLLSDDEFQRAKNKILGL